MGHTASEPKGRKGRSQASQLCRSWGLEGLKTCSTIYIITFMYYVVAFVHILSYLFTFYRICAHLITSRGLEGLKTCSTIHIITAWWSVTDQRRVGGATTVIIIVIYSLQVCEFARGGIVRHYNNLQFCNL